jgi:hypothetical protein
MDMAVEPNRLPRMPDTERVTGLLRPLPFRGDLIAAGCVPFALGIALVAARMQDSWGSGVRLVVVAAAAALLLLLAWRAPVETNTPRMYVSVLFVAAFPLLLIALFELGEVFGVDDLTAGSATWIFALVTVKYAYIARARNSPICTLLAAVTATITLLAFWGWAFTPHGTTAEKWLLLAAIVVLALGAVRLREHQREHAVGLVDAAGLAAVAFGALLLVGVAVSEIVGVYNGQETSGTSDHAGWGWTLILLAVGFGLAGYAAVERARGPAWLAAIVFVEFVVLTADHGSLLWWPLLLVALGGGVIAAGLRPTTPAPPSPDAGAPAPPPPRPFEPPAPPA